ncbi:S24 family peptidase [Utexia brackfieldae]|uniref:XRE family transcriptional regulator n=1 Tax=Utexia brackfieldae TaxID=3074108 RepID=UPI00370D0F39
MSNKEKDMFPQRLKAVMSEKRVTIKALSDYTKLSYEMIRRYTLGQAIPRSDNLENIAKFLGVSQSWLQYGIDENGDRSTSPSNETQNNKDSFIVEVLNFTASAGNGYLNSDVKEVIKLIEYDQEEAKLLFNGLMSSHLKVINLKGDSMQGTFECGDAIYIDVSVRSFEGDGIYVFTFGRGLYVKRLQLIKDRLHVISDNKTYKDWDITEAEIDQLYIHGKVMLSQSMRIRKHG